MRIVATIALTFVAAPGATQIAPAALESEVQRWIDARLRPDHAP
jgi:hypothetical protein